MTIYYFIGYVYGSMHYKLISKIRSYLFISWFFKMAKLGQEFAWYFIRRFIAFIMHVNLWLKETETNNRFYNMYQKVINRAIKSVWESDNKVFSVTH